MRKPWSAVSVIGIVLAASVASAQPAPRPTVRVAGAGAFTQLSPGNQKIAQALFDAQQRPPAPGARLLTRDDIAGMKQSGKGWGVIFKDLRTRGYYQEKNLGQVVRGSSHPPAPSKPSSPVITSASGKIWSPGGPHGSEMAMPSGASVSNGDGRGNAGGLGADGAGGVGRAAGGSGRGGGHGK